MAIKKGQFINQVNGDVMYPQTSDDMVEGMNNYVRITNGTITLQRRGAETMVVKPISNIGGLSGFEGKISGTDKADGGWEFIGQSTGTAENTTSWMEIGFSSVCQPGEYVIDFTNVSQNMSIQWDTMTSGGNQCGLFLMKSGTRYYTNVTLTKNGAGATAAFKASIDFDGIYFTSNGFPAMANVRSGYTLLTVYVKEKQYEWITETYKVV